MHQPKTPIPTIALVSIIILIEFAFLVNPSSTLANPRVFSREMLNTLKGSQGSAPQNQGIPTLKVEELHRPEGTLYLAKVPSGLRVLPISSPTLKPIDGFTDGFITPTPTHKPVFIINAGFFDPNNGKPTSWLGNWIDNQNGEAQAMATPHWPEQFNWQDNPTQNERLTQNHNLKPYLPKIYNRPEFRAYHCNGLSVRYGIALHQTPPPTGCKALTAIGAGPTLFLDAKDPKKVADYALAEGFIDSVKGKRKRDPLGIDAKNARSAVGITKEGEVLLVMIAQQKGKLGMSLQQVADFLAGQGAVKAIGLDGGTSSSIWYDEQVVIGKLGKTDANTGSEKRFKRPLKSILMVLP